MAVRCASSPPTRTSWAYAATVVRFAGACPADAGKPGRRPRPWRTWAQRLLATRYGTAGAPSQPQLAPRSRPAWGHAGGSILKRKCIMVASQGSGHGDRPIWRRAVSGPILSDSHGGVRYETGRWENPVITSRRQTLVTKRCARHENPPSGHSKQVIRWREPATFHRQAIPRPARQRNRGKPRAGRGDLDTISSCNSASGPRRRTPAYSSQTDTRPSRIANRARATRS
jgi:hypothetical protein